MNVGPGHIEEKIEAASRVTGVLNNWIEQRLAVRSLNLTAGVGPGDVRSCALKRCEAIQALDLLPVPDAGSDASQMMCFGLHVGRSAEPKLVLHDQLTALHTSWEVPGF